MEVFRITLKKWAGVLTASGYPGRWNSKGVFVLYTSSSRALASLENVVHRSGEGLQQLFKVTVIQIPDKLQIQEVSTRKLPDDWYLFEQFPICQEIGDQWILEQQVPILKVPSAIIKEESNYLINPNHPDFKKIKVKQIEEFNFDPRIKNQ